MPSNDTEQTKQYVIYKGENCEWLKQANLFGKVYYDIIYKGIRKTVPASSCSKK